MFKKKLTGPQFQELQDSIKIALKGFLNMFPFSKLKMEMAHLKRTRINVMLLGMAACIAMLVTDQRSMPKLSTIQSMPLLSTQVL